MKRFSLVLIGGFLLSTNSFGASLADIDWLAGAWGDANGMEEHMTTSEGGKILGMSKMVAGGKLSFYEFFEIDEVGGNLVLKPMPFGKPGVEFASTQVTGSSVKFENPQHDFPKVITYSLKKNGVLQIAVEGTENGKPTSLSLFLKAK